VDVTEILSHLERNEGYFPRAAVQEAIDHRDEMIPALLGVLEDVARDPGPFTSKNRFIHIYAMYLLAQFRETRAYPLLVKIFSAPGELAFQLAGDVVTEDLGRILASVSGGDTAPVTSLVENEQVNAFVRGAAMDGLLTLVASGQRSRDEVVAYFKSLFRKFERRLGDEWGNLVNSCADLYPEEVMEEIREAYEDELVDPAWVAWEEVKDELARGKKAVMEDLKDRMTLITDVVDELRWWSCFDEDASDIDLDEEPLDELPLEGLDEELFEEPPLYFELPETLRRAQPKIGRNDPCPCGSGKKFKKCCGR